MNYFGMVTTAGSGRYTQYALKTFFEFTALGPEDRFILIDNDSTFDLAACPYPVHLVRNISPLGFAQNANQAIDLALSAAADLYFLNNDLIFTPNWLDPLLTASPAILSPVTNREARYDLEIFKTEMQMSLDDYLGKESNLYQLASIHSQCTSGTLRVTTLPFCCVKLPLEVMRAVGHFDDSFGKGGAEDYDYCLRAYLAGYTVEYALKSFILHFGGKSSWSGVETKEVQLARESHFRIQFGAKWGKALMLMLLFEDRSIIPEGSDLHKQIIAGNHRAVVEALMEDKEIPVKI